MPTWKTRKKTYDNFHGIRDREMKMEEVRYPTESNETCCNYHMSNRDSEDYEHGDRCDVFMEYEQNLMTYDETIDDISFIE